MLFLLYTYMFVSLILYKSLVFLFFTFKYMYIFVCMHVYIMYLWIFKSLVKHLHSHWQQYHQCWFFHVSLLCLILSICSHTGSSSMVFHQYCGFFNVSSRCLILCIFSHTGSIGKVFHQCGLFWVSSRRHLLSICRYNGSNLMVYHCFISFRIAWCWAFVVTLGATEWLLNVVDSFMFLQIAWC